MAHSPSDGARSRVLAAFAAGHLYLVNADGERHSGAPTELLDMGPCWAHLLDTGGDNWYVHHLRSASELCQPPLSRFFE